MLYALLFLPALAAIVFVVTRPRRGRVLAEAAPPTVEISGEADPVATRDALLAELEENALTSRSVTELERLAARLEAAAASLERVG